MKRAMRIRIARASDSAPAEAAGAFPEVFGSCEFAVPTIASAKAQIHKAKRQLLLLDLMCRTQQSEYEAPAPSLLHRRDLLADQAHAPHQPFLVEDERVDAGLAGEGGNILRHSGIRHDDARAGTQRPAVTALQVRQVLGPQEEQRVAVGRLSALHPDRKCA